MAIKTKLLLLAVGVILGVSAVFTVVYVQHNDRVDKEMQNLQSVSQKNLQGIDGEIITPEQAIQSEPAAFNPEIPIEEYWDWKKVSNLNLYINNSV